VLELCPSSNLLTKALPHVAALARLVRSFSGAGVRWTVATDGPEMMRTHLKDELALLLRSGAATQLELARANRLAHDISFVGAGRVVADDAADLVAPRE
jgi:adenosine deaminase